jgi:predicted TPR repeat methyltransferase
MTDREYSDAVMMLHQIARMIETKMGTGLLSEDIRDCADRLHELTKEVV